MTIRNYTIISLLKEDKFFNVYWAKKSDTNSNVILKVFDKSLINTDFVQRFRLWAPRLLDLNHKNLVKYLDFIEDGDVYAYAIEDFNFSPLWDVYRDMEPSYDLVKKIFSQLLSAVAYAHSLGITNGEYECEKIHFDGDKLLIEDFGIKNIIFPQAGLEVRKTEINHYCCFSPEQFGQNCPFSPQVDIYSLGTILFALSQGQVPFSGIAGYEDLKNALSSKESLSPDEENPFSRFIIKATQKDPQNRYETIHAWIEEWEDDKEDSENKPADTNDLKNDVLIQQGIDTEYDTNEEEKDEVQLKRIRYKQRYAILVALVVLTVLVAGSVFFKDLFYNPISYNVYTGNPLDRVLIIHNNGQFVNLLASTPKKYLFDLKLDLDSGDIVYSNVIDFYNEKFASAKYIDGSIYLVGTNNSDKEFYFPALFIIKPTFYEPFYNTDELGGYIDLAISGNKIFLLKQVAPDFINKNFSVFVEIRDFYLKLEKQIKIEDIIPEQVTARALTVFNKQFLIEFYDSYHKKVSLIAVDTSSGRILWHQNFYSDSISNSDKWNNLIISDTAIVLVTVRNKAFSSYIVINRLSSHGQLMDSIKIKLPSYIIDLAKVSFTDEGNILLASFVKEGYSLIYLISPSGKILYHRRLGYLDRVHITDVSFIGEHDLLAVGTVKHRFITDTSDVRYIYISRIDIKKNSCQNIPFKSRFMIAYNER